MRICVPLLHFKTGGSERIALRLAAKWDEAGHEVVIILGRDSGSMRSQAPPLDYRTSPAFVSNHRWLTPWLIWCLWRHLRREPCDVLFCPGNTYSIIGVAMKLLLGKRCPPVVAKVSNDLARRDTHGFFRWAYHRWLAFQAPLFDRFVAIGPGAEAEIATYFPGSGRRIATIFNPAIERRDLHTMHAPVPTGQGADPPRRFITIGRLEPQKNLPLLIEAFALARRPGDQLAIIGDGSLHDELAAQIVRLGLGDAVRLSGFDARAAEQIGGHDALVVSSDYEGLGNVIVEALARGVPVIATDCSSTTRGLLGARGYGPAPHGWLTPIRDRDQLAKAMAELGPATFDRDGALRMAARFTLEESSIQYLALFAELARSPSAFTLEQSAASYGDGIELLSPGQLSIPSNGATADRHDQTGRNGPC